MPARTATKRTTRSRAPAKPAARKVARKPAKNTSTTIVVRAPRRAPSTAASLAVISSLEDDFNCGAGLRGYGPMTYEELQKQILAQYACKMKALCLQKKNFTNALILKYGPKEGKPEEPATLNKSEAEYYADLTYKMEKLKFDVNHTLEREKLRSDWNKGDRSIRQTILGPDMEAIKKLESKYGPESGFNTAIFKTRNLTYSDLEDPTAAAEKLFGKRPAAATGGGGGGGGAFGDYDYDDYEQFLDDY